MLKSFIGKEACVVVSTRGANNMLQYVGKLTGEADNSIEMENVKISYLMPNLQRGIFGDNVYVFKENQGKVVINKSYIVSCDDN